MTWQDLRNVLIYPLLLAGGIAWALLFVARLRGCARVEAVLGIAIGLALAAMGALGLMALAVAHHLGPGSKPGSFVFFLAVSVPAAILVAGAAWLFIVTWRDGHRGGND